MSAHTEGPWVVPQGSGSTNNGTRRQAVWTANGDIQIADCRSDSLSLAANVANARLIAAAPDLLAVAKHAQEWTDPESVLGIRLAEVIAKAEGK